jgi:type IV pilus assembly protein PilC
MIEDVDAGLSFSQALERQGTLFSDFFVSMIRSSEATGNLNEAMSFLADYTEKEGALWSRALAALIYPVIISILFFGVAIVMIVVVFPQLAPVFEQSGVELPLFSKILIGSGTTLSKWWPAALLLIVVLIMMILSYARTPEGRAFFDDLKIRLPIASRVYVPVTITRFANAMAILLRGGIPVAQALEIVSHTVNNVLYEDALHDISDKVRQGEPLSQAIARYPDYFPALVAQMIVVGEATGRLDQILTRLSGFYTQEADRAINTVVDLIQPLMMVVIGGLVGLLFASILLPMSQLTSSIH